MNKALLIIGIIVIVVALVGAVMLGKRPSSEGTLVSPTQILLESTVSATPIEFSGATSSDIKTNMVTPGASQIALTITIPKDKAVVSSSSLTVVGKTIPTAEVYINDSPVSVDTTGGFSSLLTLEQGENVIRVVAIDSDGKASEVLRTVTYTSPR